MGTGFGAIKPVGIGFGAKVNVINEPFNMTGPFGTGFSPYTGTVPHLPIEPGTFRKSENLTGDIFTLFDTDNGNGTFSSRLTASFVNGTIDYVTGQYTLFTTIAIPSNLVYRINYTYYQYNATPIAGVTTNSSGAFTALAYVPAIANGTYVVTAIDAQGTWRLQPSTEQHYSRGSIPWSYIALVFSGGGSQLAVLPKTTKIEKCSQVKLKTSEEICKFPSFLSFLV